MKRKITPWGTFLWASFVTNINWRKAWLLSSRFCISNKVKEIHNKILHKIYRQLNETCSFGGLVDETAAHL